MPLESSLKYYRWSCDVGGHASIREALGLEVPRSTLFIFCLIVRKVYRPIRRMAVRITLLVILPSTDVNALH